jgi:enamine deaminase RidA (YjgF/YER057c/UK114 family)
VPVQLIRAADLYGGVPYAYASVAAVPATEFVFAAGACPLDQDGKVVAPGDVPGQARQAVANLASALKAAGASLTDVLKTTIYVALRAEARFAAACRACPGTSPGATTFPS